MLRKQNQLSELNEIGIVKKINLLKIYKKVKPLRE